MKPCSKMRFSLKFRILLIKTFILFNFSNGAPAHFAYLFVNFWTFSQRWIRKRDKIRNGKSFKVTRNFHGNRSYSKYLPFVRNRLINPNSHYFVRINSLKTNQNGFWVSHFIIVRFFIFILLWKLLFWKNVKDNNIIK